MKTMNPHTKTTIKYLIFVIMVILAITLTVVVVQNKKSSSTYTDEVTKNNLIADNLFKISPIDFTVGSPESRIHLTVYNDADCPFCKKLEAVLDKLLDEHGEEVSITYRHYKLPIYPASHNEHLALECVGILEGPDAYRIFQNTVLLSTTLLDDPNPVQTITNRTLEFIGTDKKQSFEDCFSSTETAKRVATKVDNGTVIGVRQTPTWFVTTTDKPERIKYVGSVSYPKLIWLINSSLTDNFLE